MNETLSVECRGSAVWMIRGVEENAGATGIGPLMYCAGMGVPLGVCRRREEEWLDSGREAEW